MKISLRNLLPEGAFLGITTGTGFGKNVNISKNAEDNLFEAKYTIGQVIVVDGRPGVVLSINDSGYMISFDGTPQQIFEAVYEVGEMVNIEGRNGIVTAINDNGYLISFDGTVQQIFTEEDQLEETQVSSRLFRRGDPVIANGQAGYVATVAPNGYFVSYDDGPALFVTRGNIAPNDEG